MFLKGRLIFFFIFSILLLFISEAVAIDNKGNFLMRGIGSKSGSCGSYVSETDVYRKWEFESWMLGYISGVNAYKKGKEDYSKGLDAQGLVKWMDNYCQKNPLDSYGTGVEILLNEILKK